MRSHVTKTKVVVQNIKDKISISRSNTQHTLVCYIETI